MATTAKLKPEGTYEIFQDGQRVATGTPSILSQYGLSETNLTNEATTPSGQKVNPITGQIINGDVLKDTPPLNFATPDFTPPSDISGLQPAEIKMTPQEVKQTDLEKRMSELQLSLAGKSAFEAEKRTEFGVLNAQQAYDDLNTQLRDLQRQQQLVPLDIQRQSEGRGRTEGGVEPLEIGKRRALAYDALTTSSLIDAAQGRLASAERKVIEAVNQKFAPQEAEYNALLTNLNIIKNSPETTVQEMNRANKQEAVVKARQEALTKAKEQATNIINWANKAAENMAKQGTIDTVMLNKIKNSKTESEAFALAAPFLAAKDKLTGQSDFEQAFLRDNGRLPTVAELQAYKTSQEKPTFQTFERAGRTIRQVLDPMTGEVKSETDLGAKDRGVGGKLSSNAQAVIENPNLLNSYTNTVKGQVIAELQGAGYDTSNLGVKPLSDTAIKEINQTETALDSLQSLRDVINNNLAYVGPISGLAKYNPYSKARQVQAEVDRVKQMVGKALEGGVLRKEDEEKYKKILATITDTPETALYKIDSLISTLQRDTENYKNLQLESGRTLDIKKSLEKKGSEIKVEDLRAKYNY